MESEHKFMLNDILRKKRKSKMRKPEYPVFLTYGPIHVFPLGWIKRWKEDIICICQRLRYGYCYRDAWAIDQWFLVIIPNMLNDLRINGHGYPGSFTGTEEENVRKWNRILEHMEFLFREANEETCHRKNPYEEAYDQAREAFTRKYGMFGEKLKTEEEKEQAKADMGKMLDYIDKLNELDTSGVEPMSHVFPVNNVFREDVVTNGDGHDDTLANAPCAKDDGFKVPKTIG